MKIFLTEMGRCDILCGAPYHPEPPHPPYQATPSPSKIHPLRRITALSLRLALLFLVLPAMAFAVSPAKKAFALPGGSAAETLKQFATQAGREILYTDRDVRGITTHPVTGFFTPRAALERMVEATGLVVIEDEKTGALMVRRAASRPAHPPVAPAATPQSQNSTTRRQTMNFKHALALFATWLGFAATQAEAQTVAEPGSAAQPDDPDQPTIVLSPFIVQGSEDEGYVATDTLAGTRVRSQLKDLGSAIQVVTAKFMQDLGATKAEDVLQYTTGTEVAGPRGNFSAGRLNSAGIETSSSRVKPQSGTRVRGLTAADLTRDLFLTDIPFDAYNTGRLDIQRGANSILFGLGSPAGIVNGSTNTAGFQNEGNINVRIGSWGSRRGAIDLNHVFLKDELALRVDLLDDRNEYQQRPAFNHDRRVYGALRYEPKLLARGSARTSVRINFENGDVEANRPRVTPPVDMLTPWWTVLNKQTFDPANVTAIRAAYPQVYVPGRLFNQIAAVFPDPNGSTQGGNGLPGYMVALRDMGAGGPPVIALSGIRGSMDAGSYPFVHDHVITDPSVFDYYNQLLDGPNKREWQDFNAFNATLTQTFLRNRAGIELAYDHQDYTGGVVDPIGSPSISVDFNTTLVDGRPNPNLGRPYMTNESDNSNGYSETKRETLRVTAFYELDFKTVLKPSRLAEFLGRHVFTGVYNDQDVHGETRNWAQYVADPATYGVATGTTSGLFGDNMPIVGLRYLGPSLAGLSSPAGAHISGLTAVQTPTSGPIGLYWNPHAAPGVTLTSANRANPASYVGWVNSPLKILSADTGDIGTLYNNGSKNRSTVTSKSLVWQGFLLGGNLVPLVGWREDTAKSWDAGPPPLVPVTNGRDVLSPTWVLPATPVNEITGRTTSYSLVAHTPDFIKEKMPLHTALSVFYNKADNFQPAAGRSDIFGNAQPAPSGKTKDYGFTLSTLDDRVTFRATWYESRIENGASPVFGPIAWWLGALESWSYYQALQPHNDNKPAARAAFMASLPSQQFVDAWNLVQDANQPFPNITPPAGLTALVTQVSKGLELELNARLTKNWDLTVNAAKQESVETDVAAEMKAYVQSRIDHWRGPAGTLEFFGAGGPTVYSFAQAQLEVPFLAALEQQGKAVPELRKWRFNAVTNYRFTKGRFKNVNIGGAVRWQDKIVTGYPAKFNADGVKIFDITKPYYGPSEANYDLWLGYERKFTGKVKWRVQFNVRNLFAKKQLIPTVMDSDGTMATGRIPELTNWYLTNTFMF